MRVWISIAVAGLLFTNGTAATVGQRRIAAHHDYHTAMDQAETESKMALVWFYDSRLTAENDAFEDEVFRQPEIAERIAVGFVLARLSTAVEVSSGGEKTRLLDHAAFIEMQQSPGLAIIDMTEAASPLHR